jgi:UDP-N-acetylglucosamine--N-acetylmuramyl-(pentapeptide) pyrophosphoryl-undecaprenol N-acetylglucosamine transferase
VRSDLQNLAIDSVGAALKFGLEENKKTLLIIGCSNGSREINKLIFNNLNLFESLNIQLLWQCGKIYYEHYKKLNNNKNIKVYDFIDKMNLAYEVADIIISRAGASSISELCIVGKPVIFLPSPNVAEDHQSKNALSLVNNKAALMIEEKNMNKDFKNSFSELINDREIQNELSRNIKKQAKINATRDIVNEIEKLL